MSTTQLETNVSIRWWPAAGQTEINASDKDSLHEYAMDHVNSSLSCGFREGHLSLGLLVGPDLDQRSYRGYWQYSEDQPSAKVYDLPFGIRIQTTTDGASQISSTLSEQFTLDGNLDEKGKAYADALEALLVSLACAGVDLDNPKVNSALKTAVEQIAQHA
ncbi:hypothetical protein [Marinobacter salicampi]|uniref:hypothetical protein n=1 Tax=Marinobacter salicampi TaxID=435907 RepID=UPI00140C75F3|nr:hypothetical protein [Marinobacter salicampi]